MVVEGSSQHHQQHHGRNLGGAGGGGSSGGTGGGDSSPLLSPEEIRRRRVAVLGGGGGSGSTLASETNVGVSSSDTQPFPPSVPPSAETADEILTPRPPATRSVSIATPAAVVVPDTSSAIMMMQDDEDDDAELQAALALSLSDLAPQQLAQQHPQQQNLYHHSQIPMSIGGPPQSVFMNNETAAPPPSASPPSSAVTTGAMDELPPPPPPPTHDESSSTPPTLTDVEMIRLLQKVYTNAEPFRGLSSFHKLMWDDQLTTDSDKTRWVSQGIDVRREINSNTDGGGGSDDGMNMDTTTTENTSTHGSKSSASHNTPLPPPPLGSTSSNSVLLDAVSSSHLPWGLVQHHGGPCGVMAAIQAELLRTLLFGTDSAVVNRIPATATVTTTTTRPPPESLVTTTTTTTNMLPVRTALARAVALILARATLTPSALQQQKAKDFDDHDDSCVRIVLPSFLNVHNSHLTWQNLEPWHTDEVSMEVPSSSSALTVYRIPVSAASVVTASVSEPVVDSSNVTPKRQKVQARGQSSSESIPSSTSSHLQLVTGRIDALARVVEAFLLDETRGGSVTASPPAYADIAEAPLDFFRRPGGVLLMVLSLTASRTVPVIREEFDDPVGTRLTAQFGHCGQELMNLLLTGQAVSNVFDNTLSPSGDMVCRGIQKRPAIGYLTQLEAMRYCEVGGYYKSPQFPIWVVGSTSHFTVLFGEPAALKESQSDMLLDECRRAFKAVEGGEENGFVRTDQLEAVLNTLNINLGGANIDDESARRNTLAAALEVSGAGIVLWDDFWKAGSRLLTGASLETVLHGGEGTGISNAIILDGADQPPPLLTNYAANSDVIIRPAAHPHAATSAFANYIESDEEMARRLGAEWGNDGAGMSALTSVASLASSMEIDQPVMSDEDIARKLQEQFDSENAVGGAGGASVVAVSGSPVPVLSDTDDNSTIPTTPTHTMYTVAEEEEDAKPAAQPAVMKDSLAFEQFGDSFSLFHYNGLHGGILTPFRITRLTADEAVGASIALNRGAGGSSHGSSGSQDLEDVVRTKWPSCVINWLGKQPPYID